jgi:hypothetical protein
VASEKEKKMRSEFNFNSIFPPHKKKLNNNNDDGSTKAFNQKKRERK